jgi:MoxR-like ATPase
VWDQHRSTFEFRPGPIFCNLLLADEINRTPPKTQSALLEAMGEHQVSVEGSTRVLDPPFVVLATQNPIEYEGTYPLPEAQLDRFLFRLTFGYPDAEQEWSILERRLARDRDEVDLRSLLPRETLLAMREAVEHVHVDPGIGRYLVALSAATRATNGVEVGVSPRGTLALLQAARAHAALTGRDFVVPEDVKALAEPALAHRIVVRPDHWVRGLRGPNVVRACLDAVPTPATEDAP